MDTPPLKESDYFKATVYGANEQLPNRDLSKNFLNVIVAQLFPRENLWERHTLNSLFYDNA